MEFIVELYRAANEIPKLAGIERVRLIERALATIRSMTGQLEDTGNVIPFNPQLKAVELIADDIQTVPDPIAAHALLEAADIIKSLHHLQNE